MKNEVKTENKTKTNINIKNRKLNKNNHSFDLKTKKGIKTNNKLKKRNNSLTNNGNKYLFEIGNLNDKTLKENSFEYEYNNKLVTKFHKKFEKGSFIYYESCKRSKGWIGKCKYNKKDKKWYTIKECNKKFIHDIKNFDNFYIDYKNKKLTNYEMNIKKYREYFVKVLFKENEANNYNDIIIKFKELFKKDFINDIKFNAKWKNNKLDFISLCYKINLDEEKN